MYDFVKVEQRGWSPQRVVWVGRLATFVFIVIAAFWPLVIRDFPGLFNYIQQVFSYAVPPIAAVFLLAHVLEAMTGVAALATLGVGHALGACILGLADLGAERKALPMGCRISPSWRASRRWFVSPLARWSA